MPIPCSHGETLPLIRSTRSGACSLISGSSRERIGTVSSTRPASARIAPTSTTTTASTRGVRRAASISTSGWSAYASTAPIANGVSTGPSSQTKTIAATASAAQLRVRRCAAVRAIAACGRKLVRRRSMQAFAVAVAELEEALLDREAVARVRHVLEVRRQIRCGRVAGAEARRRETTVAPFLPRGRKQDHEPLQHGVQAQPVVGVAMDLLQVAQHARDDLARRRRLQKE